MIKHLSNIDLAQNEIKNVVIHNLTSAPEEPKKGQIYFNTIDNKFYVYENETWSSYLTLEELKEKYYDKSQIDNMISAAGGFPDQTDNGGKVLTTDGTSPSWNHIINMNNLTESTSAGISNLVINKLTQAEYDELLANNQINDNELYTIIDANTFFATKDDIPTLTSQLANDSGFITETELDAKGYLTEHQDISGKADKETTYTKEEVDELIENIEVSGGDSLPNQVDNTGKFLTTDGETASWDYVINMNNVTESTTEGVSKLVINKLTQAEYDELKAKGQINPNELYMTTDNSGDKNITKLSELENDVGFITEIPSEYITETELDAKGYLTEHQDISGKADKETTYTKEEVDELIENIEVSGGDSLPNQTDNAGKVLTTNGEETSWKHIINMNDVTASENVGLSSLVINKLTQAEYDELYASGQIKNDELYITETVIPTINDIEMIVKSKQPQSHTITLNVSEWSTQDTTNSLRKEITSLLSTDIVWVSPLTTTDSSNETVYVESNIRAVTQEDDFLTFYCDTIPTTDVNVQLIIQHV